MEWVLLILTICGIVGGLLQAVPIPNEYVRRASGALIALGFLGLLIWSSLLTSMAGGMLSAMARGTMGR